MAARDKLYVHTFQEYEEMKLWALVYYPKLLLYFYNISLTYKQYHENRREWAVNTKEVHEKDFSKLGDFKTTEEAITNLQEYYKKSANYKCPFSQANDEVEYIISQHNRTEFELEDEYMFPIMNTPFKIDRKLKWICPVPCVREYLHKQCGVNPKLEWLYRLFWRGKKYF